MHESFLVMGRYRHARRALALSALASLAYLLHRPLGRPSGALRWGSRSGCSRSG